MTDTWSAAPLSEVVVFRYGKGLTAKERMPGTIPVVGSGGVVDSHNEALVEGPGIVIGRKGNVGSVTYLAEPFWPIDTTYFVSGSDTELDLRFLAAALTTLGLERLDTHAAVPGLNRDVALSRILRFPPLPSQRVIATVLAAYDELIENNLRRIEILEEMAQAVYREWFVNFRFPGHEDVALVDSPLGRIPEGWEASTLGQHVELAYGKALKAEHRRGGDIPVLGSSGVVGWHDKGLVPGPGIVVGRKGNVGSVHWVDTDFYPIDTTYYVVSELPLYYLVLNLRQQNFINSDAAVPGLNRNQAYANPILVPPSPVLECFAEVVEPTGRLVRNLRHQNTNLRATRDLLLPRLVSGEIDVSDLDVDSKWLAS